MRIIYLFFLILLFSCKEEVNQSLENLDSKIASELAASNALTINSDEKSFTEEFMILLNNHRKNLGLRALILNDDLSTLSTEHSLDMAKNLVPFGHTGFSDRCKNSYVYLGGGNFCAENVAMGQKSPEAVFSAWMNSSGHRANMENSRITHTGFGYATNENNRIYWTQIFIEYKN